VDTGRKRPATIDTARLRRD